MTDHPVARAVRADLVSRRWLRLHCMLIGLLTLATAWAMSGLLMHAGVGSLAVRYAMAFGAAYVTLLGLLYLWANWLLSRDEGDWPGDLGGGGGGGGTKNELPTMRSGKGGDFGGGGGGGGIDAPELPSVASEGAAEAAGTALEALGAADELAVVLVPLALVVGVAVAVGAALGFVVFGLFGVEVLLAVAVEIALASAAGALAYKAGREGWLAAAWARTRVAAVVALGVMVTIGLAIDLWMPSAVSLPQALQQLRLEALR
jgi:hypothetical protein